VRVVINSRMESMKDGPESIRRLFVVRCVSLALTTIYVFCVMIIAYWDQLGLPSVNDFTKEYSARDLQDTGSNSTLDHDPFNCTYPRGDGKLIPNPKCTSIVSLALSEF
jgi:hypothetical protein